MNGIKLHYEAYGQGAPLLLIHGNGGSIAAMGYQIEAFASQYQVIAADSRGQGQSEMGPGSLTYEQIAEDLNALLDQLGVNWPLWKRRFVGLVRQARRAHATI